MVSERDAAQTRAQAALDSAARTLAAPRHDGPLHRLPDADEGFDAWRLRKEAERARADIHARAAARPATQVRAPAGNTLSRMTDEEVVAMLGQIVGTLRAEMLAEIGALSALMADQEARLARLEGKADA